MRGLLVRVDRRAGDGIARKWGVLRFSDRDPSLRAGKGFATRWRGAPCFASDPLIRPLATFSPLRRGEGSGTRDRGEIDMAHFRSITVIERGGMITSRRGMNVRGGLLRSTVPSSPAARHAYSVDEN